MKIKIPPFLLENIVLMATGFLALWFG